MKRAQATGLLAGLVLASALPVSAQEAELHAYARALATLQLKEQRLQTLGWRLVTGNARYCSDAAPQVGLLLQDVTTYDQPDAVRFAAGLRGDIAVQAVAQGSPAAAAGVLPNDEVLAIDGRPIAVLAAGAPAHARSEGLMKWIGSRLSSQGAVVLRLRHQDDSPREIRLAGVSACPSLFETVTEPATAQADGQHVRISATYGETPRAADALTEGEQAFVVAHELAHNLLRHAALLDRIGRSWENQRITEREADRLAIWLLFNAGLDPDLALRAAQDWQRRRDAEVVRPPTHEGWLERRATIAREIALLRERLRNGGDADWSRAFAREPGTTP